MATSSGVVEPMSSTSGNRIDLINEVFVLLITYHLYQFTEFMTDYNNRGLVGKSMMAITITNIVINIGFIVNQQSKLAFRKIKIWYLSYKQRLRLKQRQQAEKQKADRLREIARILVLLKSKVIPPQKPNNSNISKKKQPNTTAESQVTVKTDKKDITPQKKVRLSSRMNKESKISRNQPI